MRKSLRGESGQVATEYMLLIGVVVISVISAAYFFVPMFNSGVNDLAYDVRRSLATGELRGGVAAQTMSGDGHNNDTFDNSSGTGSSTSSTGDGMPSGDCDETSCGTGESKSPTGTSLEDLLN